MPSLCKLKKTFVLHPGISLVLLFCDTKELNDLIVNQAFYQYKKGATSQQANSLSNWTTENTEANSSNRLNLYRLFDIQNIYHSTSVRQNKPCRIKRNKINENNKIHILETVTSDSTLSRYFRELITISKREVAEPRLNVALQSRHLKSLTTWLFVQQFVQSDRWILYTNGQ